jgi:hypothetical protein
MQGHPSRITQRKAPRVSQLSDERRQSAVMRRQSLAVVVSADGRMERTAAITSLDATKQMMRIFQNS